MPVKKSQQRRTPFNLPPAWSPGLALPENVVGEGLERRALVTMQVPDGTFDNPAVGTGGYVVPKYIQKEKYGRGTYVSAWQQRGTYNGPGLPNWLNYPVSAVAQVTESPGNKVAYVLDSLHGDPEDGSGHSVRARMPALPGIVKPLPGPFEDYAQHTATILMRHALSHPPTQRQVALKQVMNRIDPSLYGRAAAYAKTYERAGVPPRAALHHGIARAMGTGLLSEVIRTGQSRMAPPNRGQLGLGCYGTRAGGLSDLGGILDDIKATGAKLVSIASSGTSTSSTCSNPPPGFTWVPAAGTIAGHWERLRVGQTVGQPNPALPGCVSVTTRDHTGDTSTGVAFNPVTGTGLSAPVAVQMMKVGPFDVPSPPGTYTIGPSINDHRTDHVSGLWNAMPAAWQTKIGQAIVRQWQNLYAHGLVPAESPTLVHGSDLGIKLPPLFSVVPGGLNQAAVTASIVTPMKQGHSTREQLGQADWVPLYLFPTKTHQTSLEAQGGGIPLYRATHPITGEEYGLWLKQQDQIDGGGSSNVSGDQSLRIDPDGTLRIGGPIRFLWQKIVHPEGSDWDAIANFFEDIGATLEGAVEGAVSAIGDAACSVLNSSLAPAAAAAGAAAVGVPPQAGAAGVALGKGACGKPAPGPLTLAAAADSLLLPLALGGAALVAIILLTGPKKASTTKKA